MSLIRIDSKLLARLNRGHFVPLKSTLGNTYESKATRTLEAIFLTNGDGLRYRLLTRITAGDKMNVRLKIIDHILSTKEGRSYLSEMEGELGFTRRTLLFHLTYLVKMDILSAEYETMAIGEEHRPVVIKWYKVNEGYKWLREAVERDPA
jgi:hypothetical protein